MEEKESAFVRSVTYRSVFFILFKNKYSCNFVPYGEVSNFVTIQEMQSFMYSLTILKYS